MKVRLPNSGGAGNMNQMLKQAQKMQADMAELQADLEQREYTATSGGGMIEVTVDGKHHIKALKINPDAVDPEDTEMLEDLYNRCGERGCIKRGKDRRGRNGRYYRRA